jgi:hypothetical protein
MKTIRAFSIIAILAMLLLLTSTVLAAPAIIATGQLLRDGITYPAAVITYDQVMDDSDTGSNPGIQVWSNSTLSKYLQRSNDNNGQWDYQIAGAYFANNQGVVFGTRTGSHGPQGRVWKTQDGMFLAQFPATVVCDPVILPDTRELYGPFAVMKGTTLYPAAYVTYDPVLDASGVGSNPGINVWSSLASAQSKTGSLWRSNDNNGQWNYRVDCVYGFDNAVQIIGARSGNGGATWPPYRWYSAPGAMFLVGTPGL